ncbi:MAG: hypothetical protein GF398_19820 [Chitinivibrionales bacterium]|nr:hypothetical protein [Chitinivibrionales bacterium]
MKHIGIILIGLIIAVILVGFMVTFKVNFYETIVLTTFGKASIRRVKNTDGTGAGLHTKWPWPIQRVIRFDRRMNILEDRLEQQETKDKQVVVAKAYAMWRITDPLLFYRSFRNPKKAELYLKDRLRSAKAALGKYAFEELINADSSKVRITQAQNDMLLRIRKDLQAQNSGIEISSVGINRIVLPEKITRSVFTRMRQTRKRLAQNARSEGKAVAQSIISQTESDRDRILAFTERLSQDIRSQGDAAAAEYYRHYSKNKEFAIFLRKLEALKKSLERNTTFILDTDTEPIDLLKK